MAEKQRDEKDREGEKDREDEEELTYELEYFEEPEQLLEAGDKKKPKKEESDAGGSKPSPSKKGEKGSKFSFFKKSGKQSKSEESPESKPSTSKQGEKTESPLSKREEVKSGATSSKPSLKKSEKAKQSEEEKEQVVGYRVWTEFGSYTESKTLSTEYASQMEPGKVEDLSRAESGSTLVSLIPGDTSTEEPYHSTREVTGLVVRKSPKRDRKREETIKEEESIVPLYEVSSRPLAAASVGELVMSTGLQLATLSTPVVTVHQLPEGDVHLPSEAPSGEAGTSGGPQSSSVEEIPLSEGASPAKKTKVTPTPLGRLAKIFEGRAARFQRLESTTSESSATQSPQVSVSGLSLGGSESTFEILEPISSGSEDGDMETDTKSDEKEKALQPSPKKE